MPIVNFYQLNILDINTDLETKINKLICDLIFENYLDKKNVYVLCLDEAQCYKLDEYIINYQETNFFPYQLIEPKLKVGNKYNLGKLAPVCLAVEPIATLKYDTLINLSNIIPDDFIKYKLIIELVIQGNITNNNNIAYSDINISREHYKHYLKYNCQNNYINEP